MMKKLLIIFMAIFAFGATNVVVAKPSPEKRIDRMFKRLDKDKNGTLSKKEFMAPREKQFKKVDKDGDGEVSKDEMMQHVKMQEKKREERRKKREARENS